MIIKNIRLSDFRNVEFADVPLCAKHVRIYGINAQGKSNMLEALSLLAAMRSFRTAALNDLIRFGQKSAQALIDVEKTEGASTVLINITQQKNTVAIDDNKCPTLADFIGKYPVLAMGGYDLQLVKAAPALRRRFIDVYISSLDAEYFAALRNYHKALANRNMLLKSDGASDAEFSAFEIQMAQAFSVITEKREFYLKELSEKSSVYYGELAKKSGEKLAVVLRRSSSAKDASEYAESLKLSRAAEKLIGSTKTGPHKDDILPLLAGKAAIKYASDGQQRSVALSLRLAQLSTLYERKNEAPVLLCDDILGELDDYRKEAFWNCIDKSFQVIATSTSNMPAGDWFDIRAENGKYFF